MNRATIWRCTQYACGVANAYCAFLFFERGAYAAAALAAANILATALWQTPSDAKNRTRPRGAQRGAFGPLAAGRTDEPRIAPPAGARCIWCGEEVQEEDSGTVNAAGQVIHAECELRAVIGSVGHQKRRCPCYGGTEEDPPGLTRREAALAAQRYFYAVQDNGLRHW